jgi:hypothetical protein
MKKKSKENYEIEVSKVNDLRELEQDFINDKISNMMNSIEAKKQELIGEMQIYAEENKIPVKWDEDGNVTKYETRVNPLVITNYFFKPIIPITSQEPIYNAEKLGMVFDYYCDLIAEVNDKIGYFPSSLTSFCKLAGITLSTLRNYKNSADLSMRIVAEKIYDQIGDDNITLSQLGAVRERTTIFKMKSQNELVEKEQPKVSINIIEKPNYERIQERLDKYKYFANKKGKK